MLWYECSASYSDQQKNEIKNKAQKGSVSLAQKFVFTTHMFTIN